MYNLIVVTMSDSRRKGRATVINDSPLYEREAAKQFDLISRAFTAAQSERTILATFDLSQKEPTLLKGFGVKPGDLEGFKVAAKVAAA